MGILAAYMVPHPPMIVPAVGRGGEKQIEKTTNAYERVAAEIASLAPDTIIITSPHSVMYTDYFHISPGKSARGDFGRFRASQVSFEENYDAELVSAITEIARKQGFPAGVMGERDRKLDHGTMVPLYFIRKKYSGGKIVRIGLSGLPLDHGTMVPLYFIRKKYSGGKIVRIGLSGLPLTEHYRLGQMIREAVDGLGRRAVFVASGDLSHKLQDYGPYGYAKEGPQYDERIMDVCSRAAFGELFDFDETFCERAAECGHRSFVIMAGAFDGISVDAEQLSHEDVTGVGYGICIFHPQGPDESRHFLDQYLAQQEKKLDAARSAEDPYVKLARASVEHYILHHKKLPLPQDLPSELVSRRAGAFVSIHEHGRLRGCIGTIAPVQDSLAQEIIDNAVSASTRDPRFDPIKADELAWLEISVDVLGIRNRSAHPGSWMSSATASS